MEAATCRVTPPAVLYHHSPDCNASSIGEHGIRGSQTVEGNVPSVFFSDTPRFEPGTVVVAVDVKGLEIEADWTTDPPEGECWYVHYGDVPVHRITVLSSTEVSRLRFASWFGASRAVDEEGRPLVLFHGTAGDFSEFCSRAVGRCHVDLEVGPAFFFTDHPGTANWYAESAGGQLGGTANVRPVFLSLQNPLDVDFQGTGIETLAEDLEAAKAGGHDGLIARNYDDGSVATHFIVFRPEQIKSAIGNRGTFDPQDPDICR